ncbi:uncharacterized GMC-type oxidoreductase Mb1310-like [Liolophura sinensis]|uniref:uncharacterized GMC-type oxidoreductase Mb1310-like n=1 Tax=Liolophura sinensis TaxID=3198878 RepID=UPI0031586469
MESTPVQHVLDQAYDYVIVGAGTSGCVIASRLSEDPGTTVLLLEAGGDDLEWEEIAIPGSSGLMQCSKYDWSFRGVSQESAFKGFENQASTIPRGKVLGGSSAINYNMHMRGTPHDYDIWKNMGCTGWGYADVLPYFIKSETCLVSDLLDGGFRGTSGPVIVTEARFSPIGDIFVDGGKEMGYRKTDCNGPDPIGFMVAQSNIGDGIRQSSSEVYLRKAATRPNLHIATYGHVTKILIHNNIARGVEFIRGNKQSSVRAKREVILCAGTICTPQILMLSGIGHRYHLQSHKIDVIADLPVGDNLQDHNTFFGLEFEIDKPYAAMMSSPESKDLYDRLRIGPIATNILEATALVRSDLQEPGNPNPDLHLVLISGMLGAVENSSFQRNTAMKGEFWDAMFAGNVGKHGFNINPSVTHPRSRGNIRLQSADPFQHPLIDHQTLTHEQDIKTLIEGVKFILSLTDTKPFRSVGARWTGRVLPGYQKTPFTDEYWEEVIRTLTHYTYHPAGTCKMGRPDDPTAVVDPKLRVKGVDKLRVADASIMPEITSANLNAPCVMIGEKAADLIRGRTISPKL